MESYKLEELLIHCMSHLLDDCAHITTGMASPIPAAAALLRQRQASEAVRVSILASQHLHSFTDGSSEVFDLAAQGRIDAFFLSGGQIDGHGNINLVGVGSYPQMQVRWSGSFGSAFLYYLIPKVILFRFEHSPRTLVDKVDFISAPGQSEPQVYRRGGPHALLTNRCLFSFDKVAGAFRLESLHPGEDLATVKKETGFNFEVSESLTETPTPDEETLQLLRGEIAERLSDPYPAFTQSVFGK
ncbi:MAG: CoA-transferase [Gammaproteobacteria bacterium]